MFCNKCGDKVEANETYCNKCGNYLGTGQPVQQAQTQATVLQQPVTQQPQQQVMQPRKH